MDRQTYIDLTLMVVELRLAAQGPVEHVGQRLGPRRLNEVASVIEKVIEGYGETGAALPDRPANDTGSRRHTAAGADDAVPGRPARSTGQADPAVRRR